MGRGWSDNDTQATERPCRMSVIIVMRRSHALNCRHEGGALVVQWRRPVLRLRWVISVDVSREGLGGHVPKREWVGVVALGRRGY